MSDLECMFDEPNPAPLRVLVVDDQLLNRRVMQALLAEHDCSVTQAASGEEALAAARIHPFDLVVMDLHLPGCSGDEAARGIRAGWGSRRPFIVRWTTDPPAKLEASLYDGQMPKPITLAALDEVIVRARQHRDDAAKEFANAGRRRLRPPTSIRPAPL
jgi:CheY-like chemotaxis protein